MGYYEFIGVKISGQNKQDQKNVIIAKLKVICAEYDLDFTEFYEGEED